MTLKTNRGGAISWQGDESSTRELGAAAVVPVASDGPAAPRRITPLPRKQMSVLTVVLMTESVCGTMLLPFVPRLIAYLKHIAVEEAGYYTGILVGLFMLGQVVSSKLWGYMSDTYGRKVPLIAGLLAGAFAMLFFGYTKSFIVCCALRFLHGFFNGNVLVAKTMIADITDRTNEAQGFALVSITWGVGNLFGPFIGGFLYNPSAKSYLQWLAGGSLRSFFEDRPAFLPSFTIFIYTMVALFFCVFMLKETNVHRKHFKDTKLGRWVRTMQGHSEAAASASDVIVVADESTVRADAKSKDDNSTNRKAKATDSGKAIGVSQATGEGNASSAAPALAPAQPIIRRKLTYVQAMSIGVLRNITIFYMLLAASDMTYGEILPLWGNAEGGVGGMGLTENAVAMLMLSYSIPSVVANLYFHHVCRFFSEEYIVLWRYSLSMYTIATLITPIGSKLGSGGYYYVMFLGMFRQVGLSWCYSLIHMLTAKAAPLGCVGSVYGISQSFAAATRCVVPFIVAPLFAWSLRRGHIFPFNYYLVFLVAAIPAATSVLMSFYVQITRTVECELDFSAEASLEDDAYHPDGSHHRTTLSGDDEDDSDGRESTYMSLASSFCTNPLHDTYVNMTELMRTNAEAVQELRMHLHSMPGRDNDRDALADRSSALAAEDGRHAIDTDERFLPPPPLAEKE